MKIATVAAGLVAAFLLTAILADALIASVTLTRSWWGLAAIAILALIVLAAANEAGGMTLGARYRTWREMRRYR